MPSSKRRRVAAPTPAQKPAQQSTISFRSTKVVTADAGNKDVKSIGATTVVDPSATNKTHVHESDAIESTAPDEKPGIDASENESAAAHASEGEEIEDHGIEEEERELDQAAVALSETRIKSYWATKELERKAPRLHQEDLTVREKILREFDMSSRFGPGIGISRHARWHRAQKLGMEPPTEVLAVLLKESQSRRTAGVQRDVEKSIVDDLIISSRARGDAVTEA